MTTTIIGREILKNGFPPDEGRRLAEAVLNNDSVDLDDVEIDLTAMKPALLISGFFNSFLQRVYELKPQLLEVARTVSWRLDFEFQQAAVKRWVDAFKAQDPERAAL